MPDTPRALDIFDAKRSAPVSLPSALWDLIAPQIRERSWFVSLCGEAHRLQALRDQARDVLAGTVSKAEARNNLRDLLAAEGYAPDGEHPMQDLRRRGRLNLILETNIKQVAGYARHEAYRHSVAYPAQRLVRLGRRNVPRDWGTRWRNAYAQVGGEGAHPTEMVALTLSPIWRALSRFGQPYPPYDYNSGMGQQAVGYDEAERLGLISDDTVSAIESSEPGPLNEGLESGMSGIDDDLKDQITRLAGGRVRWQDDTLTLA